MGRLTGRSAAPHTTPATPPDPLLKNEIELANSAEKNCESSIRRR
jgi:hypothetical protein